MSIYGPLWGPRGGAPLLWHWHVTIISFSFSFFCSLTYFSKKKWGVLEPPSPAGLQALTWRLLNSNTFCLSVNLGICNCPRNAIRSIIYKTNPGNHVNSSTFVNHWRYRIGKKNHIWILLGGGGASAPSPLPIRTPVFMGSCLLTPIIKTHTTSRRYAYPIPRAIYTQSLANLVSVGTNIAYIPLSNWVGQILQFNGTARSCYMIYR